VLSDSLCVLVPVLEGIVDLREDAVHQRGGHVRHAPAPTRRTEAAAPAGAGHDAVEAALVAVHAHEAAGEGAAAEKQPAARRLREATTPNGMQGTLLLLANEGNDPLIRMVEWVTVQHGVAYVLNYWLAGPRLDERGRRAIEASVQRLPAH
jgi:hypothetical protein